jgi:hypothetical protein
LLPGESAEVWQFCSVQFHARILSP